MPETNPFGANRDIRDPREQVCWDFYIETIREGRPNAYAAAIKAGYEESTSKQVTVREWFIARKDRLKRKDMFSKAERNLDQVLDLEVEEEGRINPQLLKIKTDVSVTVAKTLGKNEGYSERQEITGKNGQAILLMPSELIDKHESSLSSIPESDSEDN